MAYTTTDTSVKDLMNHLELVANNMEKNAGMAGRMDDGGAGIIREQVKYYKMGLNNEFPSEWKQYVKQADPEYDEYLRLKNKFKD